MRLVIAIWCLMLALVVSGVAGVARAPGDQVEEGVHVCLLAGGGAEPLENSNGSRRTSTFAPSSHSEGMGYSFVGGIHDHSRGDVVGQTDGGGSVTWEAAYEGFGKRTDENGTATGRQRANTKDEDATGLLNEGHRYRCLETGVFLTRDPAGFVDGPNVYSYVRQNPWTMFDPLGLFEGAANRMLRHTEARQMSKHSGRPHVAELQKVEARDVRSGAAAAPYVMTAYALPFVGYGVMQAPGVAAWAMTPAGIATSTDVAISSAEMAAGIEGPGFPTPGDLVRLPAQAAIRNADGIVEAVGDALGFKSMRETVEEAAEQVIRVQHATSAKRASEYIEGQQITSPTELVWAAEAKVPGQVAGTQKSIMEETAAKYAEKVVEFDVSKREVVKDQMGDIVLDAPVDLQKRNPIVIDVPKD